MSNEKLDIHQFYKIINELEEKKLLLPISDAKMARDIVAFGAVLSLANIVLIPGAVTGICLTGFLTGASYCESRVRNRENKLVEFKREQEKMFPDKNLGNETSSIRKVENIYAKDKTGNYELIETISTEKPRTYKKTI